MDLKYLINNKCEINLLKIGDQKLGPILA